MSTLTKTTTASLAERLRIIRTFAGLPDESLEWLASRMTVVELERDEILIEADSPADRMFVVLDGQIRGRGEAGNQERTFLVGPGEITGMLPYSRLTSFPLATRAVVPATVAVLPAALFPEMLARIPDLGQRLVGIMADRIREQTKLEQQRDKLVALGKLSAGLAHELNNPAAAARRAAQDLRVAVQSVRGAAKRLDARPLGENQRVFLAQIECDWDQEHAPVAMDSLERSDREEQVSSWLERRSLQDPWTLAAALVDAGVDVPTLERVAAQFDNSTFPDVVTRLSAAFTISKLVTEIESSVSRMSELVGVIKEYSHMDEMPQKEIDIHPGIESTLIMLKHRFQKGIKVVRDYDRGLPKICAFGSELNQVWTNLIDNAVDAMNGEGELRIRTAREVDRVLVEIRDSGSGIPASVRDQIFDPFFTTKPPGSGTGLGLDTVRRIIRKHQGEVRIESEPGNTRFLILLPIPRA